MNSNLYTFTIFCISHIFMMTFTLLVLELRRSRRVSAFIAAAAVGAIIIIDACRLLLFDNRAVGMLLFLPQAAVAQSLPFLLAKKRNWSTLFVGLTSVVYAMVGSISGVITVIFTHNPAVGIASSTLIHAALLAAVLKSMREAYADAMIRPSAAQKRICIIPAMFYLCTFTLAEYPASLYDTPQNAITAVLLILTMFVTYILISELGRQQRTEYELIRDGDALAMYARGLENEASAVKKAEDGNAMFRHEIIQNAGMIATLMDREAYTEAREMLKKLTCLEETEKSRNFCRNVAMNSIVSHLVARAEQLGITVDARLDIPQELRVSSMDLAVVLANIIENAIYAAAALPEGVQKLVTICGRRLGSSLLIEVTNPCPEKVALDPSTGFPLIDGVDGHGFGRRSIAAFTTKYDAVFDCSAESGKFSARLLINGC
ncbi:MAG: GHKL domain-containing protein [Clostridia bacterium]|nr:GHKL domain-containing protein [Clostridia bacterium]